ncbi:hypothetical protein RCL1_008116 [Eukaryota sp. TZLM3-RCL]
MYNGKENIPLCCKRMIGPEHTPPILAGPLQPLAKVPRYYHKSSTYIDDILPNQYQDSISPPIDYYVSSAWTNFASNDDRYVLPPKCVSHCLRRAKTWDFVIYVQTTLHIQREALIRAISYFDRFCYNQDQKGASVHPDKLCALAVSCLFIASKLCDRHPPSIVEVAVVSQTPKEDILKFEVLVISNLCFELSSPSALCFLHMIFEVVNVSSQTSFLSHYLLELFVLSPNFSTIRPSLIALSIVRIACDMLHQPFTMQHLLPLSGCLPSLDDYWSVFLECSDYLRNIESISGKKLLRTVFNKYNSPDYEYVSNVSVKNWFIETFCQ